MAESSVLNTEFPQDGKQIALRNLQEHVKHSFIWICHIFCIASELGNSPQSSYVFVARFQHPWSACSIWWEQHSGINWTVFYLPILITNSLWFYNLHLQILKIQQCAACMFI